MSKGRKATRISLVTLGVLIILAIAVVMWANNDERSDKKWERYKSEPYGFSFKYPSDWTVQDNAFLDASSTVRARVYVDTSAKQSTVAERELISKSNRNTLATALQDVNGVQVLETDFSDSEEIYFNRNDVSVILILMTGDEVINDKILSSIK